MKKVSGNSSLHNLVLDMHKHTPRHVLVVEADLRQEDKVYIFGYAEKLRLIHNRIAAEMNKRYEQLVRTKKYRALLDTYKKAVGRTKDEVVVEIRAMREKFGVTPDDCHELAKSMYAEYGVFAVFSHSIADHVWMGMEKIIFEKGKRLHYKKRYNLPCIRATQKERGIVMKAVDGKLQFALGKLVFNAIPDTDRFQSEELANVVSYLENPKKIDEDCALIWKKTGIIPDTFRPCFATLIPTVIRGKLRVFIHLNIEGKPLLKYDGYGNVRHKLGEGIVGVDVGTQTVAYTSEHGMGLNNLAERTNHVNLIERKIHKVQKAMERSRRAMNPDNFDENGVYKKGAHKWIVSNHYIELHRILRGLYRTAAINRKLAINEQVNVIRSLGRTVVTEPSNAKSLKVKAKEITWNEKKGRHNRRKRYGKSVQNRCPGLFVKSMQKKFEGTGGKFITVSSSYRASQYDCTADEYIKKELRARTYTLYDGTFVQRDLYSSFLLWCIADDETTIDKDRCLERFDDYVERQNSLIDEIIRDKRIILNSGIRV